MKRFMIVMAVLLTGITTVAAQLVTETVPFNVKTSKLERYLNLRSYQTDKVNTLNETFIQMQKALKEYGGEASFQDPKMKQILAENLAGMKEALSKVQFEKYVGLLQITNKNTNVLDENVLADLVKEVSAGEKKRE
ncbi:MAG: hypothetical protein LBJ60_00820 [Tannerellaceae bacterium]|nr:hypothetical protein [Tannerellaceae bacterium]